MVIRVETIELTGFKSSEVMEEFKNDVMKKIDEGWVLLTQSFHSRKDEFRVKYEMERRYPLEVNEK